jgi:hypothetical protein
MVEGALGLSRSSSFLLRAATTMKLGFSASPRGSLWLLCTSHKLRRSSRLRRNQNPSFFMTAHQSRLLLCIGFIALASAFTPSHDVVRSKQCNIVHSSSHVTTSTTQLHEKISQKRREQLGIGDDQDEYDLDVALAQNTDDFISKIVAGSLIVAIVCLLVAGIVIPATTDYGDGVCNPLLTGGRC